MTKIKEKLEKGVSAAEWIKNKVEWAFIIGAIVVSIIGTQRYTQLKNDIKSALTHTVTNAELQFKQGRISRGDLDSIKTEAERNDIHYWRDIFYLIGQLNYSGIRGNMGKLYHNFVDPDQALQSIGDFKRSYEQILNGRNEQFSAIETALKRMDDANCSKERVQDYQNALLPLKDLGFPVEEYMLNAEKIELKCYERASFSDLSDKVLKLISEMKSNNYNSNEIANEVGYLFGNQVAEIQKIYKNAPVFTPAEKQEMQESLVSKTEELSERVSKELGYIVQLEGYL